MSKAHRRQIAPVGCALFLVVGAVARAAVVTNAADTYRTGWYSDQASLTPALVASPAFALRFDTAVDGQVYAQPLVAKNSLIVATETNWVYRMDPETGAIQWARQLAPPWNPADIGCGDLVPWIGVTGTPVIDEATDTVYLFAKTYAAGTSGPAAWFAHALDLLTGEERVGFPVPITGTAQNGGQLFSPTTQLQRPGLLLLDGVVYAGFGGHCDISPWQGWIVGVSTSGVVKAFWTSRATVGGDGAAIWQSGGGLISDGPSRIIVTTGNGGAPASKIPGSSPPADLGESVIHQDVQGDGTLRPADFFTPYNATLLDRGDVDLGSGGPMAFPDAYFGTSKHPHLAVEVGKQGIVYLLDRDDLGGCQEGASGKDAVVSESGPFGGVWARPSVWPGDGGYVYYPANGGPLRALLYSAGSGGSASLGLAGSSSDNFGFGSSSTVVTSNGTASGSALVWVVYMPDGTGAGAEVRAYDPVPQTGVLTPRFTTSVGTASKFNPPGIWGGRVYVGTRDGHVKMFGPTLIQLTVDKAAATGSVHLSWTGGSAPFTLVRAEDPDFTVNPTTLVDHQSVTSFDDPVLADGKTYYYRVR